MGVILPSPEATAAQPPANQQPQQPRPFAVGAAYDRPAERDGILYLKVNVPPGSKCTGRLQARITGADKSS